MTGSLASVVGVRYAHTVEQVREAEAALMARLPEGALMQRAAHGLAYAVLDLLGTAYGRRVLLLVGSGDNGGDALYAGAVLARRGVAVEAWLLTERAHEAGLAALRRAGGRRVDRVGRRPDLVVDGIVGIGGRPGLRPEAQQPWRRSRASPWWPWTRRRASTSTPASWTARTSRRRSPSRSAPTRSRTWWTPPRRPRGSCTWSTSASTCRPRRWSRCSPPMSRRCCRDPPSDAQKYTRGVVGVRAGSSEYPGAALLSVAGAGCGLAGMVRYVGDDEVATRVRETHPEVVGAGKVQAWVVGSGSGEGAGGGPRRGAGRRGPAGRGRRRADPRGAGARRPLVLTPHAGELARMLGTDRDLVESQPLRHARDAAEKYAAVVLLKGRHTLIAAPDGRVRVTTTGTPWLATAGAGDVLGGLIGALLATGLSDFDAASVGSWVHGAAATLAAHGGPLTAGDVAKAIPAAVAATLSDP